MDKMSDLEFDSGPPWWQALTFMAAWFFGVIALVRLLEPIGLWPPLFWLAIFLGQIIAPLAALALMAATGLIKELPR
jgi:hypothetical protein